MPMQRRIDRHQLPYYLKVFNRVTDKPMGYIGNLSLDGMMLISQLPMLVGGCFDMRLKIPGQDSQVHHIDLCATCQWCQEDVTPGHYDSGFALVISPPEYVEMIETLRHYFSFRALAASA
ncbi:PilZ domain-containing protein [Pseudomonas mangiferae]|uniref:PilZ domain-containing protein n=1 Tax=Pseudomonas mangiferae TaxID=2593654 RepID=A0A553H0Y4_9PSED|nr:PilZ domain-containing protein [Pseudomonas mangiferae]TRX75409.1 PilZ domain-containing protein [Pseudomonas mangiferae]